METLEKNGYTVVDKYSHYEVTKPNNEICIIQKNNYNHTIDEVLDTVIYLDFTKNETNEIIRNRKNINQDNPFTKLLRGY